MLDNDFFMYRFLNSHYLLRMAPQQMPAHITLTEREMLFVSTPRFSFRSDKVGPTMPNLNACALNFLFVNFVNLNANCVFYFSSLTSCKKRK